MQATYVSELYDDFLFSIKDYTYLSADVSNEDIEEDLAYFLKKAKAKFRKCKNRLDTLKDDSGQEYFGYIEKKIVKVPVVGTTDFIEEVVETIVEVELTEMEKSILTHLMVVEHLKPQVLSSEVLRPSLSDKSFKIYSQANHLRELNLLYRLFQKECNKMITEYTYLDLEGKQ